jgi:DNA-binding response OmpR family regulator
VIAEQRTKRLVPVWLRVPGHADLAEVADEHLVEEIKRRGYVVLSVGRDVALPGLLIYADRAACVWKGAERHLTPCEHEVLTVLGHAYPRGMTVQRLKTAVWGGSVSDDNVRTHVYHLRRRLPGLIGGKGSTKASYRLDPAGAA